MPRPDTPTEPKRARASRATRILAVLLVSGALSSAQLTGAAAAPVDDVTFDDPAFRQCVSGELRQPSSQPITRAQAASVTDLYCEVQSPRSIGGAEALTNLVSLRWDGSAVSDLTPLAGLSHLRRLIAPNSPISDLSPLRGLTGLTALQVDGPTTDLTPLSSLTNLDYLALGGTWRTLEPLRPLTKLQTLYLSEQQGPVDISALAALTRLNTLWLRVPDVTDLAPLRRLTGLTDLLLNAGPADFSVLKPLRHLQKLSFGSSTGEGRGARAALKNKPDLIDLAFSGVVLHDLDPLATSSKLQRLTVGPVGLRDISALRSARRLTDVNLSGLRRASVRPLGRLPQLTDLRISESRLGPLRQFRGFPALTSLFLDQDHLRTLSGFRVPARLTYLDLESNHLRDLGALTCDGPRISALDQTVHVRTVRVGRPFRLPLVGTPEQTIRLGTSESWTATGTTISYDQAGTFRVPFAASKPQECSDLNTDVDFRGVVVQTAVG